jgi:hypothetical protein
MTWTYPSASRGMTTRVGAHPVALRFILGTVAFVVRGVVLIVVVFACFGRPGRSTTGTTEVLPGRCGRCSSARECTVRTSRHVTRLWGIRDRRISGHLEGRRVLRALTIASASSPPSRLVSPSTGGGGRTERAVPNVHSRSARCRPYRHLRGAAVGGGRTGLAAQEPAARGMHGDALEACVPGEGGLGGDRGC